MSDEIPTSTEAPSPIEVPSPIQANQTPLPSPINLQSIVPNAVEKYGKEKVAEITGRQSKTVSLWLAGTGNPSPEDLEKLIGFDPDPLHKVIPLYPEVGGEGSRLAIVMVTNRAVQPATMESILRLYDSAKMRFIRQTCNDIQRGRNQAAARFLESDCEWAFFVDDDVVLQCGDSILFKRLTNSEKFPDAYAGAHTIGQLLSRQKTLIGGAYVERRQQGRLLFNEPTVNRPLDRQLKDAGPRSTVLETKWVASGCMLVHRSVFLDIAKRFPDIKLSRDKAQYLLYEYGFFDRYENGMGEDVSFCIRAAEAGHKSFVDLAVMPGHIGPACFTTYNT